MNRTLKLFVVALLAGSVGACANMSRADKGTAIGAATGAVVGHVLSGGDAFGTIGGAAVGGVLGREATKR